MYLKDLIEWLEQQDQNADVIDGFGSPHSDRDYSEKLAFKPVPITTFGQMLTHAKSALGRTFNGYNGGEYVMDEFSECRISEYGRRSGEDITSIHLKYWALNSQRKPCRIGEYGVSGEDITSIHLKYWALNSQRKH